MSAKNLTEVTQDWGVAVLIPFMNTHRFKLVAVSVLVGLGCSSPTSAPETIGDAHDALTLMATVDDKARGSGENQFEFAGTWVDCGGCAPAGTYQNGFRYAYTTGARVTFRFTGTKVKLFGVREKVGGIGGVTLDGQAEPDVDMYGPTSMPALIYESPMLASGSHTLVYTVLGKKNPASGSNTLTVDKAEVYGGSSPTPDAGPPPPPPSARKAPLFIVSGPAFTTLGDVPKEDGPASWLAGNGNWSNIAAGDWLGANPDVNTYPNKGDAWWDLALPMHVDGSGRSQTQDFNDVAGGLHDGDYRKNIASLKAFGIRKVIFRISHEVDIGPADPTAYKAAFNHLAPVLRQAAAANGITLKIAWSMVHEDSLQFLPDVANVDLLTPDIYLCCWSQTNVTESQVIACVNSRLSYLENLGARYHRPIGFGETAAVKKDFPQGNWTNRGAGDSYRVFNETVGALVRRTAGTDHYVFNVNYYNLKPGGVELQLSEQPNTRRALRDLINETRAW